MVSNINRTCSAWPIRSGADRQWLRWRAFSSERKTSAAPKNFIDGDLIESILELPQRRIAEIAGEVGISAEQLVARIESLAQATH